MLLSKISSEFRRVVPSMERGKKRRHPEGVSSRQAQLRWNRTQEKERERKKKRGCSVQVSNLRPSAC